ncbi:hypothetical protein GOP47_0019862 [Adiantum capillus-veneris]|uniref:Uncharacterized protein n=1 Tax=Adiantum capillus-veneris TaxID=13818 RepID=A0A9D4Z906_ADICA|nr:hypothetical protein GOP47_0019862 [Adiantum capillus-veneris]
MAPFAMLWSSLLGFIFTLTATSQDPASSALIPPDGNTPSLSFVGRGVQIYECSAQSANGSYSYQSQGAEAELFVYISDGKLQSHERCGRHYFLTHPDGEGGKPTFALLASPSADNSSIPTSTATFKLIAIVAAANPKNIPSLLLRATSHSGNGALSMVSYVQRVNTVGGVATPSQCKQQGAMLRVPYRAQYRFWSQAQVPLASIPASIMVPKGHTLLTSFFGLGFQIYRYDGSKWTLSNVSATLSSLPGTPAMGKHYFLKGPNGQPQPTWEFLSPRGLVSAKLIQKASKTPNDIPWFLLLVTNSIGKQSLASMVTYVQRSSTVGGMAPTSGTAAKLGDIFQSPYSAIYSFYGT